MVEINILGPPKYDFFDQTADIRNSGQSSSIVLTGDILDCFYVPEKNDFVPLSDFLESEWIGIEGLVVVTYKPKSQIRFSRERDIELVKEAWLKIRMSEIEKKVQDSIPKLKVGDLAVAEEKIKQKKEKIKADFDRWLERTGESSTIAVEFLRQLCFISRHSSGTGLSKKNLVIIIEAADMIFPKGEISRLFESDRTSIAICRNLLSDPEFVNGNDAVVFLCESREELNQEISSLPQLREVQVSSPGLEHRLHFIQWFCKKQPENKKPKFWSDEKALAEMAAGLSIHALMQLLKECVFTGKTLQSGDVVLKLQDFIKNHIGDMVEFLVVPYTSKDIVGNTKLKQFLYSKFVKRLKIVGDGCINAVIVAGPNGSGKTFVFSAVIGELGIPVIILKNFRDMYFGQSDIKVIRLELLLRALHKAAVFVDEADAAFGGLGRDVHETERRLTSRFQMMMSDRRLRGHISWILMTARVHLLPADIRRAQRGGDMIIPVLDPEGDDLKQFVEWTIKKVCENPDEQFIQKFVEKTKGFSAADFALLRDDLIAEASDKEANKLTNEQILVVFEDRLPADISTERRIQTLHALLNCTSCSLLPEGTGDPYEAREKWREELLELEIQQRM